MGALAAEKTSFGRISFVHASLLVVTVGYWRRGRGREAGEDGPWGHSVGV